MGIVLLIVAVIVFVIVVPVGMILLVALCKSWDNYCGEVAKALDIFSNVLLQHGLNYLMLYLPREHNLFGQQGQTMSEVFCANYINGDCTRLGLFFCKILIDFNDPAFKK